MQSGSLWKDQCNLFEVEGPALSLWASVLFKACSLVEAPSLGGNLA